MHMNTILHAVGVLAVVYAPLGLANVQLTYDGECSYGCQEIPVDKNCYNADCGDDVIAGASIGNDASCDFYRGWWCAGGSFGIFKGPNTCFQIPTGGGPYPIVGWSVKCYPPEGKSLQNIEEWRRSQFQGLGQGQVPLEAEDTK